MNLELQFKIKNNQYYRNFLIENSHWYKYLNRHPKFFSLFDEEVKDYYELRLGHKITKAVNTLELIQNFMSTLT